MNKQRDCMSGYLLAVVTVTVTVFPLLFSASLLAPEQTDLIIGVWL